jgi:superfamily II DNA or RNA helicase
MTTSLDKVIQVGRTLLAAVDREAIAYSDIEHAARLASAVRRGARLTVNEARQAYRMLNRATLAVYGLDMPEEPDADDVPTATAPAPSDAEMRRAPLLRIRVVTTPGKEWRGIAVSNAFHVKDTLKRLSGKPFKDVDGFEWRFPATPATAAALMDSLAGTHARASTGVRELATAHRAQADHRVVLDESAPLPVFDTSTLIKPGFELWDHQFRALDYCSKVVASLLAIRMGGGKTLATIALVNKTEASRVIIACPNKVRGVWGREMRKFSAQRWHLVDGFRPSKRARSGRVSLNLAERLRQAEDCLFDCGCGAAVHAVVVNYEAFGHEPWATWRPEQRINLFVADEIHRAKAPTGKVSRNLAKWVEFTDRRVGLTGTPMPQTPLDVFGYFRMLDPGIFGTKWTMFRARYAQMNPHVPGHVVGYKNIEELRDLFYSITYLPTIDLKLPEITDVTREFELEPKARKAYDDLDENMWADLSEFRRDPAVVTEMATRMVLHDLDMVEFFGKHALTLSSRYPEVDDADSFMHAVQDRELAQSDSSTISPANTMVRLLRLQQFTGGTLRDDDGIPVRVSHGKQELLAETLEEIGCARSELGEPEPVVVFCRFRSDLDAVAEVAAAAGLRYKEVSGRRQDGLTHDSEMAPDCDVVAVQIQSGGTGVDLTRARIVIWYSMGYSLSDYDQARARLHRPGQTRPVLSIHLLAEDTADMDVYEALSQRRSVVSFVLNVHGIDAEKLGFKDYQLPAEEVGMIKAGQTAVRLPFNALLDRDKTRIGEPGKVRKT